MADMERARFQISIRDLFWVTLWAALAVVICQTYWRWRLEGGAVILPLFLIPIGGLVGTTFFGRPIVGALVGLGGWMILSPLLIPVIQAAR
jgi:hypothetical protein